jgi:uncharacterized membrane protein YhhN
VTPPLIALSVVAAISAALCIAAQLRGAVGQVFLWKPLTTAAILLLAWMAPEPVDPDYRRLVVAGLAFSLGGDVFLMLPGDRFLPGLTSFLVAHGLYIAAFVDAADADRIPSALIPFALATGLLLRALWRQLGALRAPVCGYAVVIATMGAVALAQWQTVSQGWATLALLGAMAFIASDAALALDRFRGPLRAAPLAILGSYFPAQWLIALSVMR